MLSNLRQLFGCRGLVQILVARELKARYRGSVLGFFWSFVNPLLLLLVYSFVFTVVMPRGEQLETEPYAVFLFCGLWQILTKADVVLVVAVGRCQRSDR